MEERNLRKVLVGTVVSNKMDKTIVVAVEKKRTMQGGCMLSAPLCVSADRLHLPNGRVPLPMK